MINFKCVHIEERVRKELRIPTRTITEDDLIKIKGIFIRKEQIVANKEDNQLIILGGKSEIIEIDCNRVIVIPWYDYAQSYGMNMPNIFLNVNELTEGWKEDMKLFMHIVSFHSYIEDLKIDFIEAFPNLGELYLYKAEVPDWSVISRLLELKMLFIRKCEGAGNTIIKYVSELWRKQNNILSDLRASKADMNRLLDVSLLINVYITYAGITDISPLSEQSYMELNLSHNLIADITPLKNTSVYYLNLRYNQISNVESLRNNYSYLVNLRHNQIASIEPVIDLKCRTNKPSRFFIAHNPIPKKEVINIMKYHFVMNDFDDF